MRINPQPAMLSETQLREILDSIGTNRDYISDLIQQLRSDLGVIPFVGAGMSVPFKLPAWDSFLELLAGDAETKATVKALLNENKYEQAADFLFEIRGADAFQSALSHTFAGDAPEDTNIKAAVSLLARFPNGPVLTTNFDKILETVFTAESCAFSEVITASRTDRVREALELNANVLIKLHGDAADRGDRVFTFTEYEKQYSSGPVRTLLENVTTRCLLFLGCSLRNDRPMKVLQALAHQGRRFAQHFAVVECPSSDSDLQARMKELTEIGIRPVFYPAGRHDLIEPLLSLLADKIPENRRRNRASKKRPLYHNLRIGQFELFGREKQLKTILELFGKSRIVAIEGTKGVGKTAFALHTLRRLIECDLFNALVWTSAAGKGSLFSVSDIVDAVSLTLDFPFTAQAELPEKERLIIEELNRKGTRCLVTVDNYETIANRDVDNFLAHRLPTSCSVLITSASKVPFSTDGLSVFSLDELDLDDALLLFRARLEQLGLEEQAPTELERLYRVVGGNALALEWIGGQMREGLLLNDVLTSLEHGQASILDVFQGSWDLLPSAARKVLCAMSLFPTPPTQQTLSAACDLGSAEFGESIKQLRRLYLLKVAYYQSTVSSVPQSTRFVVHPFTREFAGRQRHLTHTNDLHIGAAKYFVKYVSDHGGNPQTENKSDFRVLNAERHNMLSVLDQCYGSGAEVFAVELTVAMARWLFIEGHWSNLETEAVRAIASAEKLKDRGAAGCLWAELGRVYSHRSQFSKADDAFAKSLAHAIQEPPDCRTLGYLNHHIGEARIRQKRYNAARQSLDESLRWFRLIDSRREIIGVRYRLAVLAVDEGNYNEARQLLEKGIEDTVEEAWERLEGLHRRYLGELEIKQDNADLFNARDQLERARELISETDTRTLAFIEHLLAEVDERIGNSPEALKNACAARDHFEKLGMKKELEQTNSLVRRLS